MHAGQRDKVFTLMYSSNYLASSVGPVVAAVLFYFRGNNWWGALVFLHSTPLQAQQMLAKQLHE